MRIFKIIREALRVDREYVIVLIVAASLFMALILAGCSSVTPVVQHEYIYQEIPESLLAPCPGYTGPLDNNGDLARAYIQEKAGRESCNADKEAIQGILNKPN